jgi:amino acid adenylation domain-containing protein
MKLPPEQEAIVAKCFHPAGKFIEFPKEEVETSIPERFEKMAGLYPDRIAVKTRTQQLTYFELREAANRIAAVLLAKSGTERVPVGLLFPKGIPLVVSILGTLKAGKICVPLDPTFPQSRISHMLANGQVKLILTLGEYLTMTKAFSHPCQVIDINEINDNHESSSLDITVTADDLAFIFYTSGSTGAPKGVSENHRNLLFHVRSETNDYHLSADDRLIFFAASGRDVLRALLNGACVYPVNIKQEGLAPLADWLIQSEITIFTGVVTVFRHFVQTLDGTEKFPHLRLIKLVGEMVQAQDIECYRKYFSHDCILVNSYGPNEAGHVAHYFIDKKTNLTSRLVPIGYSVDGKDVILIGEDGREVDSGTVGEIIVRSRFLSPGYWRRPNLTRAKFLPANPGLTERLYLTGDLGVRRPDGCLTLIGRQDFQVKIRGNRVEISEVESALMGLGSLKEAVVVAHEDGSGEKRLVAYVVPATQPEPTVTALQKQLAEKLPQYMIPSVFMYLDRLPIVGIGKVNRQALPDPDRSRPNLDTPFAIPLNPVQKVLAEIWAEVLSLDRVGMHDNFFELGGHSLAATRVVSQVLKQFQLEIPLRSLFESPTIADMAAVIAEHQGKKLSGEELEQILTELESLSDDEAQKRLSESSSAVVEKK